MQETESSPEKQDAPERIDSTFRNGSVTAVGIILGFSLGFISQWASNPIAWSRIDLVAAAPIVVGIGLQVVAFADLLSPRSLILRHYERARVIFLVGLTFVALGVAFAMLLDVFGLGPRAALLP